MIKTRPLCFVCLCFLIIQVMNMIVTSGGPIGEIPASSVFYDEREKSVLIHGQVYKKVNTSNIQILYLKNNSINDSNIMVYDKNFIDIAVGQTISLQGTTQHFQKARNPGNFNQSLYYAKQNIYGVIWCEQVFSIEGEENFPMEHLHQLKLYWKKHIYEAMGDENGAVLAAMLLGERSDMAPETKELYQKNGFGHVLAISGLHISFIGLGIYKCIRKTGLGYIPSGLIAILILSLYALMIGFSVSVIRAYVMLLFRMGADMSGQVYDMLTALMVVAAITVGIQPLYLVDAGFLLSYGAILGILFVLPTLGKLFGCRLKLLCGYYASLAINIMLFPIILLFYYEFPTYSIIQNMFIIPLMSVLLGLGTIGSLISFVAWPAGKVCLQICTWILELFELLGQTGNKLPFSRIVFGQPKLWKVVCFYLVLLVFVITVFHCKNKEWIKRLRICFCGALCIFCMLMAYQTKGSLTVTMLDVGQGDCIFIKGPKGMTYLIDGGSSDVEQVGKNRIESFLKSQGVGELDYVFLTHGDVDHYSGIKEMFERQEIGVSIKHIVLPSNWKQDAALVELSHIAQQQGISVGVVNAGQCLIEGNMQIMCVQPTVTDVSLIGNAGAMVLSIRFGEFSMLCTGDVEGDGETALAKRLKGQSFSVLKVAHHGSKNSSSEAFLHAIRPQIALISAGENNSYGHPHKETLERLQDIGCKILETTKNGAITLQTDGNSLTINHFLY